MIFPFLRGILKFSSAPITWTLFFLNTAVLIFTYNVLLVSQRDMDLKFGDQYFMETQGHLYAQFIDKHPDQYSAVLNKMSTMALEGDQEKVSLLGTLAVRNNKFLQEAPDYPFFGDQVAIKYWKENLFQLKEIQISHPSYILGLNAADVSLSKWVSYIFVHSGPTHFAGNMLFLLIFGCMLEPLIGGLALLVVFLGSGMLAAGIFLFMTGATAAPLVGASGAISGIMALFCCLYFNKPVRFVYWTFIPSMRYAGFVYLPAWVALLMWMASDLAGYWGSVNEFGGIAYTAHLGGEAAGVLVGAIVYLLRFRKPRRFHDWPTTPRTGQPISFNDLYALDTRYNSLDSEKRAS